MPSIKLSIFVYFKKSIGILTYTYWEVALSEIFPLKHTDGLMIGVFPCDIGDTSPENLSLGFRPSPIKTALYSHRRWLKAWNFRFMKWRDSTMKQIMEKNNPKF